MTLETIKKRNGEVVPFRIEKIIKAILSALKETKEAGVTDAEDLAQAVLTELKRTDTASKSYSVEDIQDTVEKVLMQKDYFETAKAYILYRDKQNKERARSLFKPRQNLKPYEYPELVEYSDAIRHSYWVHTEFNYLADIHDYKVNISETERSALKHAMLAIAQIEIAVKTFWGDLYKKMPKPEIGVVGYTFAESEVRHMDAYSHLLEIMGLSHEFENLNQVPAVQSRIEYLKDITSLARAEDNREYALAIMLFSLFIEHVSLFSQFLIIMSFNKHKNVFKGISNAVEATSKEEQIHSLFGTELINLIKKEEEHWFDADMKQKVESMCSEAFVAESEIVDWIFEKGELDFISKATVKEFIKSRINSALTSVGYEKLYDVDEVLVEETTWFDAEIIATKHVDFFVKRSINYNKRKQSITSDDLF